MPDYKQRTIIIATVCRTVLAREFTITRRRSRLFGLVATGIEHDAHLVLNLFRQMLGATARVGD